MIRIGTRGSALALWQAQRVRDSLAAQGQAATLVPIVTTGDRVLDRRLEPVGGKGAFLKEIEEALLAREIDLAVHSLKDVPTLLPQGLQLCAFLEREDPRDALLARDGLRLAELPAGARVGTSSLRRQAQLRAARPDLSPVDLRGNVDTRIRRLREGRVDAILLALAGLRRLGRAGEVTEILAVDGWLPAPGQGVIALERRSDDDHVQAALAGLNHPPTARVVAAERAFLRALGGGCNVPLGAHAQDEGPSLRLRAFVARVDGGRVLREAQSGEAPEPLGEAVAAALIAAGARELLG